MVRKVFGAHRAMATLQESQYSVYPMGAAKAAAPNFSDLGKPTVTVDVTRLQAELRALHQRLEFLEVAAQVAAVEHEKDQDPDGGSASSTVGSIPGATAAGRETRPDELDGVSIADDLTTETKAGEPSPHRYEYCPRSCGDACWWGVSLGRQACYERENMSCIKVCAGFEERACGGRVGATGVQFAVHLPRTGLRPALRYNCSTTRAVHLQLQADMRSNRRPPTLPATLQR